MAILVCCIFAHLHPKYHMHLDQRIFLIFVAVLFRFYAEFLKWKDQFSCIGFFSLSPFFKLQICCGKTFWRRQSRTSKFPFLSTTIISYESWYLPYGGRWGQNLGLWRSSKWPRSKREKFSKIFLQKRNMYTSKQSWEHFLFRFEIKLEDFVLKKLKQKKQTKKSILWFSIQKKSPKKS